MMTILKELASRKFLIKIRFREHVHGGVPRTEEMIQKWLEARVKKGILAGPEKDRIAAETAAEVEIEEKTEAAWSGFKRDSWGIYLEARQVKSGLREAASALGIIKQKRGFRQEIQHLLFVEPPHIALSRGGVQLAEPDGYEEGVVHAWTQQGKISAIKRNDFAGQVECEFTVRLVAVPGQKLTREDLERMLILMQDGGLGANRSQGQGTFDVLAFDEAAPA